MFPQHIKDKLISMGNAGDIAAIDRFTSKLRDAHPEFFHDEKSVYKRVFLDEPRHIPHAGFIHAAKPE